MLIEIRSQDLAVSKTPQNKSRQNTMGIVKQESIDTIRPFCIETDSILRIENSPGQSIQLGSHRERKRSSRFANLSSPREITQIVITDEPEFSPGSLANRKTPEGRYLINMKSQI